ncbi:hypothetical protein, partial [Aeromicrobium sp. PE09-221]|uniref:hypothetical protein n=1 Tax=Aeromicrobium sp. PE09-221 TaxID=1898043 RepID=UPI00191C835A
MSERRESHTEKERVELTVADFQLVLKQDNKVNMSGESVSAWKDIWHRLRSNPAAMAGFWMMIWIAIMAIIGPYVTPFDCYSNDLNATNDA